MSDESSNKGSSLEVVKIVDSNENISPNIDETNNQEKKTFINVYFCHLSVGIIFTYIFILCSITINIVNRIIFWKYNFKFNMTLIFLQQLFCVVFFSIASKKSVLFKQQAGEASFSDFWKLRYQYIGFSIFFISRTIVSFWGYQLVKNIPMYVNLRKFVTAMTFIYQWCFKKKKISNINIIVVILLTLGAFLAGIDDYSTDIKGYLVVFMKNSFNLINLEVSENFKKKNGVTNLKLLVYNSFLSTPILFISIFIGGEYKKILIYFNDNNEFNYFGLYFYIFISCAVILVTNSSFFISNEKTSSLMTNLLTNTKSIFISAALYLFDKKKNKLTFKMVFGLGMATIGAVFITSHSFWNNLKCNKKKDEMKKVNIKDNEAKV